VTNGGIVIGGTRHTVSQCTAQNVTNGGIVHSGTGHTVSQCTARAFANHIVYQDFGKTILKDLTADNYVRPNLWFGPNYPTDPKQFYVDVFGIGEFRFAWERVWGYGYVKNRWDSVAPDPSTWEFWLTSVANRGVLWIDFPVGIASGELRVRGVVTVPSGDLLRIQVFPRENDPFVHEPVAEWTFRGSLENIGIALPLPRQADWTVRLIGEMNQISLPILVRGLSIFVLRPVVTSS